ncbi:MAG: alpha/beta fold hydrolase [Vicinamibacteraceae bacterium]
MRRWIVRALVVYLLASLAAGVVLGEFALRRGHLAPAGGEARAMAIASEHGGTLEPVRIAAADGIALEGWLFTRGPAARGTVLVAHGSGGSREHATAYAAFLLDAGFDVLTPDARGHGRSGGLASYGVREADDVLRWAAWIRRRSPDRCVYAIGSSMGGAHVLLAEAARPTFCAIVSDAAFATFLDAGLDRVSRQLGLGDAGRWLGRPAAYAGLGYVRVRYGVNLLDADPATAIGHITAPLLLIHGADDQQTPVYHARAMARAQPAAILWVVPGAGHTASWRAEPREYPRRIVAFFGDRR